ncbi:MAG: type II toxin-antitoxin system prevent-host-death family antitoxin [Alphaproteobacteria bacterium]|nr:MAG: type II toxin-antitoxin system prevent-host-death family antitoxin [Alphaproteobacteria bacterium]
MTTVNVHEAKTHFSRLLDRAAKGETIVIAKAGKPYARLLPLETTAAKPKSRIGFMEGQIKVPDDFDTMFADEIERMFYGEAD